MRVYMKKERTKRRIITDVNSESIKQILNYDKDTGIFTYAVDMPAGKKKKGDEAGYVDAYGYRGIGINCKHYKIHRLAWLYHYGEWPKNQIDHRDKNRLNNRIDNLRDVTTAINSTNMKKHKNNTSSVTGVYWSNYFERWVAIIHVKRKVKHLGIFKEFNDAVKARKAAELTYGFTND